MTEALSCGCRRPRNQIQPNPTNRIQPQAVQDDLQLQAAATKAALAHESQLHFSVNTAQQYKAAAARLGVGAAVVSHVPQQLLQELRARYGGGSSEEEQQQQQQQQRQQQRRRREEGEEMDELFGDGSEEGGGGADEPKGKRRRGDKGVPDIDELFGGSEEEEGGGGEEAAASEPEQQQEEEQQEAQLEEDAHTQQPAAPPPPAAAAASPPPAVASSASSVEAQVSAFVRGVLDPLRSADLVDDALRDLVAAKATAKIMSKHGGAEDASFLVREYAQVTKLCSALVEHYRKQRRQ